MTVTTVWLLSSEIPKKPVRPAFYQLLPENSDSVGRTFESCRAYHKNTHPTGVGIFIARYGSKFMPRRGKSCRAYQMQEIRTYSSLWEMCSDFFFLMALFFGWDAQRCGAVFQESDERQMRDLYMQLLTNSQ